VIRQNRQTLMMRALPGVVEVYIPFRLSEEDAIVRDFIAHGMKKLGGKLPQIPQIQTPRTVIEALLAQYTVQMNVAPARVQFRNMLRKWGSCSSKGTVTLNLRLTWLPQPLVEYIVCHELAHLIELNHSTRFWAIVEHYLPDYRHRQQQLRQLERTLW
jgi:predicted metal-dependent hydrolase